MTLPDERYRAVKFAREFLQNLANPKGYTRIPTKIRNEANSILRHFPSEWDMTRAASGSPDVFQEKMEAVTRLFAAYEDKKKS